MRVPDLMPGGDGRGQMPHVKVAPNEQWLAQRRQTAAAKHGDFQVLTYLLEAIGPVIGRGIHGDLMALLGQSPRKRETLPLASSLDQQLVHDKGDVHGANLF